LPELDIGQLAIVIEIFRSRYVHGFSSTQTIRWGGDTPSAVWLPISKD